MISDASARALGPMVEFFRVEWPGYRSNSIFRSQAPRRNLGRNTSGVQEAAYDPDCLRATEEALAGSCLGASQIQQSKE